MKSLPLSRSLLLVAAAMSSLVGGMERAARADGLMCALGTTTAGYVPLLDQAASTGASKEVKRLVSALCPKGCGQVGVFKNATSPNAMTVNVGSHMSKIAYSATFVDAAVHSYGAGASLGIFAHEVGHHVDANAPGAAWMSAQWGNELRADAWAGCALARAGGGKSEVKGAMQALASSPSATHPAWSERATALQKGFRSCGGATLAELEPRKRTDVGSSGGVVRGCAEDNECKVGRVCFDGKCQDGALRRACTKDVDCPGAQICASLGVCQAPTTPAGPGPAPSSVVGRMASSTSPPECHDRCGDDQESCSGRTDRQLRECKAALVAEPRYRECSCPHWPSGRLDCYQFCKETFDKAKSCEATHELAGTACLSVAARCVSDCS
jgi:hypothetical protein